MDKQKIDEMTSELMRNTKFDSITLDSAKLGLQYAWGSFFKNQTESAVERKKLATDLINKVFGITYEQFVMEYLTDASV